MSKCKDERIGLGSNPGQLSSKIPLSSIKSVMQMIRCAFEVSDGVLPVISAELINSGTINKTGLSKTRLYSNVLQNLKGGGIDIGPNAAGEDNKSNKFVKAIVDNVINEILENMVIETALPIGTILGTGYAGVQIVTPRSIKNRGIAR